VQSDPSKPNPASIKPAERRATPIRENPGRTRNSPYCGLAAEGDLLGMDRVILERSLVQIYASTRGDKQMKSTLTRVAIGAGALVLAGGISYAQAHAGWANNASKQLDFCLETECGL